MTQNCLLHTDVFDRMYILCYDFKNITENQEFNFLTKIYEIQHCTNFFCDVTIV